MIYTIDKIQIDFNVSKTLAVRFLKELEDFGLIEKRRRPNAATMIYVKNFILADVQNMEVQNVEVQNVEVQNVEVQKMESLHVLNLQGSPEYGSPKNGITEVHKMESNKTLDDDYNYFISSSSYMAKREVVNMILDRVDYHKFLSDKNKYLIDEVLKSLVDFFISQKIEYKIGKQKMPMTEVKENVLKKLTPNNFELILNNICAHGTGTIYNLQNYIITCFYRLHSVAPSSTTGIKDFNNFAQNKYDFAKLEKELGII